MPRSLTSVDTLSSPAWAARSASDSDMAVEISTARTEATSGARAIVTKPVPAPRSAQASVGFGDDRLIRRSSTCWNAGAELT